MIIYGTKDNPPTHSIRTGKPLPRNGSIRARLANGVIVAYEPGRGMPSEHERQQWMKQIEDTQHAPVVNDDPVALDEEE